jgi:serine/threonine protein kinase
MRSTFCPQRWESGIELSQSLALQVGESTPVRLKQKGESPYTPERGHAHRQMISKHNELSPLIRNRTFISARRRLSLDQPSHRQLFRFHMETIQMGRNIWTSSRASIFDARIAKQDVVIKFLRTDTDDVRSAAEQELDHMQAIGYHPRIISLLGTVCSKQIQFSHSIGPGLGLVLERANEGSLEDHLVNGRKSDLQTTLTIACHICKALHSLHDKRIIHCDIKPSNILVFAEEGGLILKLSDLGVSKVMSEEEANQGGIPTTETDFVGTRSFMAPEMTSSTGRISPAIDIYALGITLARCLTSIRHDSNPGAAELIHLIEQCCHPQPDHRPTSAEALTAFGGLLARASVN